MKPTRDLVEDLRHALQGDQDPIVEKTALVDRGANVVSEVAPLLDHPDPNVAGNAADVLEAIGSDAALEPVVSYALRDTHDLRISSREIDRLVRIARTSMFHLVMRYRKESISARSRLLFAMWLLDTPEVLPIVELAIEEADPALLPEALVTLGRLGRGRACAFLVERLRSNDLQVKVPALFGLRLAKDPGAIAHLLPILLEPDRRDDANLRYLLGSRKSLHEDTLTTIDLLAGEPLAGEFNPMDSERTREAIGRIRAWIERFERTGSTMCPKAPKISAAVKPAPVP